MTRYPSLLSFSFHLIYECIINQWIGIARIKKYARAHEGLHIVGKFRIFHFLLHVMDELLIGRRLANHKLHVFLVTTKDFVNIYIFPL